MSHTEDIMQKYKAYEPEIVTYDEEIDGGLQAPVREKHLSKKEELKAQFEKKRDKVATKKCAR